MNLEDDLREQLATKRSKRPAEKSASEVVVAGSGAAATAGRSVMAAATDGGWAQSGWDHSELQTEQLQRVIDAAISHPIESKQGLRLLSRAAVALEVRQLLLDGEWQRLVRKLESLGLLTSGGALAGAAAAGAAAASGAVSASADLSDEVLAARELIDKRAALEAQLRSALEGKAPVLAVLGAKMAIEAFPLRGEEGAALIGRAARRLEAFGSRVKLRRVRAFGTLPEPPQFGSDPNEALAGRAATVLASATAALKHVEEKRRLVERSALVPTCKGDVTARSFIGASPYKC